MSENTPQELTEEAVKSLFLYAGTQVGEERVVGNLPQYAQLLTLTRSEVFRPLGETPPASAFNADWE